MSNLIPRKTTICPVKAPLTEANLPDQTGKVFIVTGGSGGLGKELVTILYQRNAKVYVAARSASKTSEVIKEIERRFTLSKGELHFLPLVLDDLTTINNCANQFLAKESRLDVLFLNAGVMIPPDGSVTKQGYELQYGVNNLAHFLLVLLLRPVLEDTARSSPRNSVRVVWVSSSAADGAPVPVVDLDNMDYKKKNEGVWQKYGRSKAACVVHAAEFARLTKSAGVVSVTLNPGLFLTNLQEHMPRAQVAMIKLFTSEPINGAYTELFAGLDLSITQDTLWVSPYGKIEAARKDMADPELGAKFWAWSEEQVKPYM